MGFAHGVPSAGDAPRKRGGRGLSVLLPPRGPPVAGFFLIRGPLRIARVLHGAKKAVLGTEHVPDHLAQRPLALPRHVVDILVAYAGERAGQIAVGMVVLAEGALGPGRP